MVEISSSTSLKRLIGKEMKTQEAMAITNKRDLIGVIAEL